jgi:hypothetical protein
VKQAIEGLWILVVEEDGEKVPLLARGKSGLYLLAFRTPHAARKFLAESGMPEAEPRLVVRSNAAEIDAYLQARETSGVVIDYDPTTNSYRDAAAL